MHVYVHVCVHSGSSWGWSIVEDGDQTLPYICEIPKAQIYQIVRVTRGYGMCYCMVLYNTANVYKLLTSHLVMDDFKISKLDRFRFDFLKKI